MDVSQVKSWKGEGLWVWLLVVSAIVAGLLAMQAAPAVGQQATLRVDDDKAECPGAGFTTIQSAVDEADPGTRIVVCAGNYEEQVTIGSGKDDIVLDGSGRDSTTINAPDPLTEPGDVITVNGANGVQIQDFLISGPFPVSGCSSEARTGIRVYNGGSATIANNRISEIRSQSADLRGCQNGIAIVYGDYDPETQSSTSGDGAVINNVIDRYQKGGIIVGEEGSNVAVRDNTILGVGGTPAIAQNGIQVSYGGQAALRLNNIRDNVYTGTQDDLYDAGGIILIRPNSDTVLGNNTVARNDYNIALFNADGVEVRNNRATGSKDLAGIFANARSTDNVFRDNRALNNLQFDCQDRSDGTLTAGTANTWINNIGETDRPSGICRVP